MNIHSASRQPLFVQQSPSLLFLMYLSKIKLNPSLFYYLTNQRKRRDKYIKKNINKRVVTQSKQNRVILFLHCDINNKKKNFINILFH